MARGYRPVDRDQQFVVPPDMREWLPGDHPVWVLIEAVGLLDTSAFHAGRRTGAAGRAGYDPDMLLTLVLYAYARGVTSSRRIERLCWEDVGFRVICAQDGPDHTTIARFADAGAEAVQELFTEVLVLCARMGMGRLETITLDGMKIGANASKKANRSEKRLRQELGGVAGSAVAEHRRTDAAEDAQFGDRRGDELPGRLASTRTRVDRIRGAIEDIEAEREKREAGREAEEVAAAERYLARPEADKKGKPPGQARVEANRRRLEQVRADYQAYVDEWHRRNEASIAETGKKLPGRRPVPVDEHNKVARVARALAKAEAEADAAARTRKQQVSSGEGPVRNTTDPDSRLMPAAHGGFIQAYNAQNVVSADGLIIATKLTQDPTDTPWAEPMMRAAEQSAAEMSTGSAETTEGPREGSDDHDGDAGGEGGENAVHRPGIGIMLMDAGYLSRHNLTIAGPDRLIAVSKHRDLEKAAKNDSAAEPVSDRNDPIAQMADRLRTKQGIAAYRQRGHIAETPHGHIKHNQGHRSLSRRGKCRAETQWQLLCSTHNLFQLIREITQTGKPLPLPI